MIETIKIIKVNSPPLIAEVEALAKTIWREHYSPIIGAEQVDYMLEQMQSRAAITRQIEHEGYHYFLLTDMDGQRIGYIGVEPKPAELFLSKLYIAAAQRGRGFGRRAVEFVESQAQDKGLSKVALIVNKRNTGSIAAYKKLGFVITGSVITDVGEGFFMDDYRMEKVIN